MEPICLAEDLDESRFLFHQLRWSRTAGLPEGLRPCQLSGRRIERVPTGKAVDPAVSFHFALFAKADAELRVLLKSDLFPSVDH